MAGLVCSASWVNLSGSKVSASSPQIFGSRCSIGVSTISESCLPTWYFPHSDRILVGVPRERGRGGPEAQRLLEHLGDVPEVVHLGVGRRGRQVVAEDPVDLLVGLGERLGVVEQEVEGEGEQAARGLVAGYEEGNDLVADVDVVELLAALLVHPGEHGVQQVFGLRLVSAGLALRDDLVDTEVHVRGVFLELPVLAHPQPVPDRQACLLVHGLSRQRTMAATKG